MAAQFDLFRLSYHSNDRKEVDAFLRSLGQNPKDFLDEGEALEAMDKEGETPSSTDGVSRTKKFVPVEVFQHLEEVRARRLERAGLKQVRKGKNDTGTQLFEEPGASNAIMPGLFIALIGAGFCLAEIERIRKPATYSERDEQRAKKKIKKIFEKQAELALQGTLQIEGTLTGENMEEKLEPFLSPADKLRLAYFRTVKAGGLKKTHPTEAKPYGSVQVWKYIATVIFIQSEESIGRDLAIRFEKEVLKNSYWKHCHVWLNPDGTATLNVMPAPADDGTPAFFTLISFDAEDGLRAQVYLNDEHPALEEEDTDAIKELRERAKREQERLDHAMRKAGEDLRREAQRMNQRPAPGSRFGDILKAKLDGKNGDTPLPPAS